MKNSKPLLSILIPTYKYKEGVLRILEQLKPIPQDLCELIMFDNSPNDDIEQIVDAWKKENSVMLTYKRNRPSNSAADNWNTLLDSATGEYFLIMHHDEFPITKNFLLKLISIISDNVNVDVFLSDMILTSTKTGCNRRHLPMWFRELIIKKYPQYLYRRNVVGPTAALVIRNNLYPRFDPYLQWFLDVDIYVRLFTITNKIKACSQLKIGSTLGRTDSLTANLAEIIPKIIHIEYKYMSTTHQSQSIWLSLNGYKKLHYTILRYGEQLCWVSMRVLTRIPYMFCIGPISRKKIKRIFKSSSDSKM